MGVTGPVLGLGLLGNPVGLVALVGGVASTRPLIWGAWARLEIHP